MNPLADPEPLYPARLRIRGVPHRRRAGCRGRDERGLRARVALPGELRPAQGLAACLARRHRPPGDRLGDAARLPLHGEEAPVEPAAPGDLAEDSARRLSIAAAVEQLDPRDRELIALRYGADLTARQIGELLEMQTNAVEVALHRALARLREGAVAETAPGIVRPAPAAARAT